MRASLIDKHVGLGGTASAAAEPIGKTAAKNVPRLPSVTWAIVSDPGGERVTRQHAVPNAERMRPTTSSSNSGKSAIPVASSFKSYAARTPAMKS